MALQAASNATTQEEAEWIIKKISSGEMTPESLKANNPFKHTKKEVAAPVKAVKPPADVH
mgnify:CR=1 FL=1